MPPTLPLGLGLPDYRLIGVAFDPLSLSPDLWVSADFGTFQDSTLTTPAVADGDPVGGWQDRSAFLRNLQQTTAASRLTLKLAIQNGLPVIRNDGVDDCIFRVFAGLAQPLNVYAVARYIAFSGANPTLWDGAVINQCRLYENNGASNLFAGAGFAGPALVVGTWYTFQACFNGVSSSVSLNGGVKTTGNAGANAVTGFSLGDITVGGQDGNCDYAEFVVISGRVLTANEEINLLAYLKTKWGHY